MYRPVQFREDRPDVLAAAIKELQFATLVTLAGNALIASHIPLILREDVSGLRLEGHLARGNPQWKHTGRILTSVLHGTPAKLSISAWFPRGTIFPFKQPDLSL
jgi:transcriptional regulator